MLDRLPPEDGCGPLLAGHADAPRSHRHQVFDCVRAAGRISRTDVAKTLDVSPGSVTVAISDLMAAGLVQEAPMTNHSTTRGRPPVALSVVPDARFVVGIKLSDVTHTAVLTDFAGTVLADATHDTPARVRLADTAIDEIQVLVQKLLTKAGMSSSDIAALAVGMPGIVDHDAGQVRWSPLLTETEVNLAAALTDRLGCDVFIDNDVNLLTLAELWFGAGRARRDFAVVTIEHGVGMGLVLNNEVFRGATGQGLELGHTKVQLDGALCRCGRRGCLEAYVADYALVREAPLALGEATPNASDAELMDALYRAAKGGNQAAQLIFKRAGQVLSVGLANLIQLFDPKLIILSGARMRYDYLYAEEVLAETRRMTSQTNRTPTEVQIHTWGDLIWARGAAALALASATQTLLNNLGQSA